MGALRKELHGLKWAIIDIHSADLAPVAIYNSRAEAEWICQEENRKVKAFLAFSGLDANMVSAYRVVGYLNSNLIFDK